MHSKSNKWFLPLLAILFLTSPAQAQEINVQSVSLDEKADVWLVESHEVPAISIKVAFRDAGSTSDPLGKQGRAQMLAALLSEGAGDMDALAFQQALESYAIQLSFSADDDLLIVDMLTLSEHADRAFELLALALTKPRFDTDAVARIKAQMHSNLLRMEEQPSYLAGRALAKAVYAGHPYANPTEGTHEGIDAISVDDLKQQLAHYVTKDNMLVSVVGDINAERLRSITHKYLSMLPTEFVPQHKIPQLAVKSMGQTEILRRSLPQTVVAVAGQGIERTDPDFYAAYVLNHLLGGSTLTSKLGDEIREQRGLAYYAYTQLRIHDHGALFVGGFGTRNEQAAEALRVMMNTLRAVQNGEIEPERIEEAKSYIIGAFPLALADNDGIASMLLVMQRFNLGKDYLAKRNALMKAVTSEDIARVAKRLIQPQLLAVVGVGDPAGSLADYR